MTCNGFKYKKYVLSFENISNKPTC